MGILGSSLESLASKAGVSKQDIKKAKNNIQKAQTKLKEGVDEIKKSEAVTHLKSTLESNTTVKAIKDVADKHKATSDFIKEIKADFKANYTIVYQDTGYILKQNTIKILSEQKEMLYQTSGKGILWNHDYSVTDYDGNQVATIHFTLESVTLALEFRKGVQSNLSVNGHNIFINAFKEHEIYKINISHDAYSLVELSLTHYLLRKGDSNVGLFKIPWAFSDKIEVHMDKADRSNEREVSAIGITIALMQQFLLNKD